MGDVRTLKSSPPLIAEAQGGPEQLLILNNLSNFSYVSRLARKIRKPICRPYTVESRLLEMDFSMGSDSILLMALMGQNGSGRRTGRCIRPWMTLKRSTTQYYSRHLLLQKDSLLSLYGALQKDVLFRSMMIKNPENS